MSLSLELCKRLQAARYPQNLELVDDDMYFWSVGANSRTVIRAAECESDEYEYYARPNSDELIAQIQAEWPMRRIIADITTWGEDKVITYDSWDITECGPGPSGASLAEALANLYIALSE